MRRPAALGRRLTALTIISVCGFTVAWGWEATQFAEARTSVLEEQAGVSLGAWFGVPGLAAEALESSWRRPGAAALPPVLREAQVSSLLAAHPMFAQAWLSLANERLALDRPKSQIDAAIMMSRITGPNEGQVMWQRGLFELARWDALSSEARDEAALDVAHAVNGKIVSETDIGLGKALLAKQTPDARAEIESALAAAGMSQKQLALLGLGAGPR